MENNQTDMEPYLPVGLPAWRYKLAAFTMRLFGHFAAFICAGYLEKTTPPSVAGTAIICGYAGLICLFPRGISLSPVWTFPAKLGWLFTLITLATAPLYVALFWGGFVAWCIRLSIKGGRRAGTEWLVMPLFLLSFVDSINLAEPGVAIFQILVTGCYLVACHILLYRKKLLYGQTRNIDADLAKKTQEEQVSPAENIQEPHSPVENIQKFRDSAESLLKKRRLLPDEIRPTLNGIVTSILAIINCMLEDPRDVRLGSKFLNRYLPATHDLVNRYIKLSQSKNLTPEIEATLAKSEVILKRLGDAFAKEHIRLLQNDVTDFSADLNTLDMLLKMQGD